MYLDDLHAFTVFSELLNFTHSAERLAISQPALYVKVKKLSHDLGVPLYEKVGRTLKLTVQGEELARFGREILAARDRFLEKLTGQHLHQPVTLAAGAGSYLYLLGEAIRQYREQVTAPLNLITAKREDALQHLKSGRAQLAVTVLNTVPQGLEATLLCSIPCQLVLRRDHALAKKKGLCIRDLADSSLIVPPAGSPFREVLATYFQQHKVDWSVALEANGWELMMHFAGLGLGLAIVNGCCEVPRGCVAIPIPELPPANYYLLFPKSGLLGPNTERLKNCIVQALVTDR
jgi:LysR family transcriptional regulator, low CO2-responsive transcriptional regulator